METGTGQSKPEDVEDPIVAGSCFRPPSDRRFSDNSFQRPVPGTRRLVLCQQRGTDRGGWRQYGTIRRRIHD